MHYILVLSFLSAACSGPAFTAAEDPQSSAQDPETVSQPVAFDPETGSTSATIDPETPAQDPQSAASTEAQDPETDLQYAEVQDPETDLQYAEVPEVVASVHTTVASSATAPVQVPVIVPKPAQYPTVSCTLGEADRGDGPRVMHEECPDTAPYCQRHGVCGIEEYEATECSRQGYEYINTGNVNCQGLCNAYLVCADAK